MLKVKLISYTPNPEKVAAAAARLCYSPRSAYDIMEDFSDEQAAEFLQQVFVALAAEIGKVYLGGHGDTRSFHGQKPAIYPHYTACAQICNG